MEVSATDRYFERLEKSSVTLSFDDIEKILGSELPKSANSSAFWYRKEKYWNIARTWTGAGYRIRHLDLEKRRVTFSRFVEGTSRLEIPVALTDNKLPDNAVFELEAFFECVIKKYGL